MGKELAVWGWWQGQNLGDQWIKRTMSKIFPSADFIDTRSHNIGDYKFVICGGGGLFIDNVPRIWRNAYKKTAYGMIGLGAEFEHKDQSAVDVAKKSKFFYVRDSYSLECMHLKGYPTSYDITFFDPLPIKDVGIESDCCLFIWRKPDKTMLSNPAFIEYQKANYDYYDWEDIIVSQFSKVEMNDFVTYTHDTFSSIDHCDYVISGRFHGIVAAVQLGIPCIAIDVCPKIRALMKDVGLEEYCLKYNQVNILSKTILKMKTNKRQIREMQLRYRKEAVSVINYQVQNAKFEIYKVLHPLRAIHYGYYFFGSNDVVKVMADTLKKTCTVKEVELKKRILFNQRIKATIPTEKSSINILRPLSLLFDIITYRPDFIVLNSGGVVLERLGLWIIKKFGIKTVGIELSDPDVFPYNGKIYADKFDCFFTNAQYSLENQYQEIGVNAELLGFAAATDHHYPINDVEKKYDVVVVGGCRPDRLPIVEELGKEFNVATYGTGWPNGLGFVSGHKQVEAINSGKIYLSFSRTMAGYNNVKVGLFEAVACKSFVITEYNEELKKYFEIGKEIVCFSNFEELKEKIRFYLYNESERNQIAERGYQKFLNFHTYEQRWNIVLRKIYDLLNSKELITRKETSVYE